MSAYEEIVHVEYDALTAQDEGRYRQAILAHGRALNLARRLDRPHLSVVLFNRLGRALEADGQAQKAVIAYETGLKALEGDESLDIDRTLDRLGAVGKGYTGSSELAVPVLYGATTAQDLEEAEKDVMLPVKLLLNIGNAYLRQRQEGPALNAYQLALDRPEIADSPELEGHLLTGMAVVQRWQGEKELAAATVYEALELLEEHAAPPETRRALAALADIYQDQGQTERALETYHEALALYAQVDDPLGEGQTQAGMGHLLLKIDDYEKAWAAFEAALALAELVDDKDTLWYASSGLGRCQQAAGDLDGAADSFRQSLRLIKRRQDELRTDQGKVTFLESVLDISDGLIAVHLARAQADAGAYREALAVAEEARGQSLSDLMEGRERKRLASATETRDTRYRPFPERALDSPVQRAGGFLISSGGLDLAAQVAPGVPTSPVEAMSMVSQTAPGFEASLPELAPETEEVAEADKPPPLARLVFHSLADRTAVFAVTTGGQVHGHVAPLGREALTERVGQVRRALEVDEAPRGIRALAWVEEPAEPEEALDYEQLLSELYAELIAPLAGFLPADGTPLVVEPHGPLWMLPFAALRASDGTWLADQWPLLYAPSHRVLEEIRRGPDYGGPAELKALIVGNPSMPQVHMEGGWQLELDPLPGTEREARAIAALFDEERHTLLLGLAADRVSVESGASESGILHLATHGVAYAENPLASFVALAEPADGDGLLTARKVMSLSLPADLVTLSACQTGLGKVAGEGMIGLSRAFLVAGARAVLVSQWSVDDGAAESLMVAFYRWYIKIDDKALALQRAVQELRSDPDFEHPCFWAPFVVVGAEA